MLHYLALTDEQLARIRDAVATATRVQHSLEHRRALHDLDAAIAADHDTPIPYL